jgi:hypothetical protein
MQITLDLDEHLLEETQQVAARTNRLVSAVINDALREVFARMKMQRKVFKLHTAGGGDLMPGVNIESSADLLDIMDGDDPLEKLR